jgi:hypothetical protein
MRPLEADTPTPDNCQRAFHILRHMQILLLDERISPFIPIILSRFYNVLTINLNLSYLHNWVGHHNMVIQRPVNALIDAFNSVVGAVRQFNLARTYQTGTDGWVNDFISHHSEPADNELGAILQRCINIRIIRPQPII